MKRVQFDFEDRAVQQLDSLVVATGASSRAEVVRRALQTYTALLEATKEGAEIAIRKPGKVDRVLLILEMT